MKHRLIILACAVLVAGSAHHTAAQSQMLPASTVSTPTAGTRTVSSSPPTEALTEGTFLLAEFAGSINARKMKSGDKVKAQVAQAVLSHGRIVVPAESRLIGHITEVTLRTKDEKESRLGIVFDKAELKHGNDLLFQAVIVALAPAVPRRSLLDEPGSMTPTAIMGMRRQNSGMLGGDPHRNLALNGGAPSSLAGLMNAAADAVQSSLGYPLDGGNFWTGTETKPMSIGTFGVHGIKGITLSQRPGSDTPGPIIVSSTNDVKLDYGTQVIVQVTAAASTR
jgi:hypothetical protein